MEYLYQRVLIIGGMTTGDYVLLNASWMNNTNKNFKCKETETQLNHRKDAELAIRTVRIKKGCGRIHDDVKVELDGYGYKSCLCHESFQHPLFFELVNIHNMFEKGVMPFAGGLLEQPAQVVEFMNMITKLKLDNEIEQQKELEKKNKPNKGKR